MYAVGFKATTSGERLFQFVLNEIFLADSFSSVRALTMLEIGARREELSEYFVGAGAMNILGRCIKKAQRVLDGDNEADYQPMMVTFIQRVLEVPRRGDDLVDQFARLALSAAGAANRGKVNPSTKKLVMDSRTEAPCYLCGAMCLLSSEEESAQVEFEHLWPSSFGGESTFENLLPACWACNRKKDSMMLWHTGHLFSFVLKPNPSESESGSIPRREKIARHMKTVFDLACESQCTLKEAALAVGPANIQSLAPIEPEDAVDFFNFKFGRADHEL